MTQEDLGSGYCTKSFVSQVEQGIANPSLEALTHFAKRLNVHISDLVEPDVRVPPPRWIVEEIEQLVNDIEGDFDCDRIRFRLLYLLGKIYRETGQNEEAAEMFQRAADGAMGLKMM